MMKYVMLLAILIAPGGCSDHASDPSPDTPPPGTTSGANVPWDRDSIAGCDLVMRDELFGALGEPIAAMEEGTGDWFGCRWTTEGNVVDLLVFPNTDLPEEACDEEQESAPYGQTVEGQRRSIPDLGESALWGSRGDLLVCTDRGLLAVHIRYPGTTGTHTNPAASVDLDRNEKRAAAALRIASIALTRL